MAIIDVYGEDTLELGGQTAPLDIVDPSRAPLVMRLFPLGAYFDRSAGWLPATARGIARFLSREYERQATLERNIDPRTADELLDERERERGIEPPDGATLEDRRDAALAKLRSTGGVTAAYYESIAADFGYPDAVVTDAGDPFDAESLCDEFVQAEEWKLTFLLTATSQGATRDAELQRLIIGQPLLAGWRAVFEFT